MVAVGEARWIGAMFATAGSAAIGLTCDLAGWCWRGWTLIVGGEALLVGIRWLAG